MTPTQVMDTEVKSVGSGMPPVERTINKAVRGASHVR